MEPETSKPIPGELLEAEQPETQSAIGGVSVRGWMAIALTITVCVQSGLGMAIDEKLFALASIAIGFYFGQKTVHPASK